MSDVTIPGFEMLEKLGQGGMATVWKARQISLDRVVAIKILSSHLAHDPADIQRFQTEAQQAAKLKHPGIVQVYDANATGGVYYFVMEYVAGYTVGDWVRRKGVLSEKDALLVAECVADALDYAWQNARIIHCDIKPDNIIVDSDGTVKLADLGLSRTINAMTSREAEEEVMGTPAYISPEQAMGAPDLDCRADIYSLGAMLYHLVTGKLLFEGQPDERIMEMQVTDTVPDIVDVNPKLSRPLGMMIEKMLAKKREDRQADWAAVRADIVRVKKGLPILHPPPEGVSTITRSTRRVKVAASHGAGPDDGTRSRGPAARIAWAAVAAVIAGVAAFVLYSARQEHAKSPMRLPPPPLPACTTTTLSNGLPETVANGLLDSARKWAAENPGKFDEAMDRYQKVIAQAQGTAVAKLAEEEFHRVTAAKRGAIDGVMKQLNDDTGSLIREERFDEAAKVYESYHGPFASDTAGKRAAIASDLKASRERMEEARRRKELLIENKMSDFLDRLASNLTTGGLDPALKTTAEALNDEDLVRKRDAIKALQQMLDDASAVDRRILDSFRGSRGQEITVQLNDGPRKLTIVDVRDGKVTGEEKVDSGGAVARVTVTFEVKDLSAKEKLLRMGAEESQCDVALVKGLMALNSKAYAPAKRYFGLTHPLLADRLVACVETAEKKQANEEARAALLLILKSMAIPTDPYDEQAVFDAVTQKKLPADLEARVHESAAAFRTEYGATEFAHGAEALVQALERAGSGTQAAPAGGAPIKAAALPPKLAAIVGDREAIVGCLVDRNPEMRAREVTLRPEGGGPVDRVDIVSDELADIGALAAFRELKAFSAAAAIWGHVCPLADLSPLRGLPLEFLSVSFAGVRDLSPLRGMDLKTLRIRHCPVADLSAVKDLPLLQELAMHDTEIKDLTPLRGLKLKGLDIGGTRIFDIRVLAGMPLESLDLSGTQVKDIMVIKNMPLSRLNLAKTRIFDFSYLKGLSLEYLNVDETQFKDFSLLKGMPLEDLHLDNIGLSDTTVLRGFRLTELSLAGALAKDYSTLVDMPLRSLTLSGSKLADLTFLKDMPLDYLDISNTKISDLSPLKDMKLTSLYINGTRVRDLRPLEGMPLRHLSCQKMTVVNYEPLRRMPLKSIVIDDPEDRAVRSVLLSMPDLEYVNWAYVRR